MKKIQLSTVYILNTIKNEFDEGAPFNSHERARCSSSLASLPEVSLTSLSACEAASFTVKSPVYNGQNGWKCQGFELGGERGRRGVILKRAALRSSTCLCPPSHVSVKLSFIAACHQSIYNRLISFDYAWVALEHSAITFNFNRRPAAFPSPGPCDLPAAFPCRAFKNLRQRQERSTKSLTKLSRDPVASRMN